MVSEKCDYYFRFWCSCSHGTHFSTNPQVKSLGNSLGISSYHLMEGSLQTSTCPPCQEYGKAGNGNKMEMKWKCNLSAAVGCPSKILT